MCGGGPQGMMGGMSRPGGVALPNGSGQYMTRPMQMSDERIPPSMPQKSGGNDSFGSPDAITAAPAPVNMAPPQFPGGGPQGMPSQAQGPINWAQRMSQMNIPGLLGQKPEMSQPFSAGLADMRGALGPSMSGGDPMQAAKLAEAQGGMGPQMNALSRIPDQANAYGLRGTMPTGGQRMGPMSPQGPMDGNYGYQTAPVGAPPGMQEKAGLYPGAPTPPGYNAPPPGPFAPWMNPILASMLGLGGQRPPGSNALNNATGQWGNVDWFQGIPKG